MKSYAVYQPFFPQILRDIKYSTGIYSFFVSQILREIKHIVKMYSFVYHSNVT